MSSGNKSLKFNAVLSGLKTFLAAVVPLIIFPYMTRVIGVTNYGKINFVNSIVIYFSMIAALGINTYAVREGAAYRDDRGKSTEFVNQIFTINLITTAISYVMLVVTALVWKKMQPYTLILAIQSLGIISTTIAVDWIYTIYEDYLYITKRYILIQLISILLIFITIKQTEDYYIYCIITVGSNLLANVFNLIHSRKYVGLHPTKQPKIKTHIKSILILFFNEVSIQIYVNSDTTLLGILCNDYIVGIYSVASKIYSIIKRLISSVLVVTTPRFANYYGTGNMVAYKKLQIKVFKALCLITLPAMIGLFFLSKNVIGILSGTDYIEADRPLKILCVSLLFSVFATYAGNILLIEKQEKKVLMSTTIAAITNISLNLLVIPIWGASAAAMTTAISEFIVMILNFRYAKNIKNILNGQEKFICEIICISIATVIACKLCTLYIVNYVVSSVAAVTATGCIMLIICLLFKESLVIEILKKVIRTRRK